MESVFTAPLFVDSRSRDTSPNWNLDMIVQTILNSAQKCWLIKVPESESSPMINFFNCGDLVVVWGRKYRTTFQLAGPFSDCMMWASLLQGGGGNCEAKPYLAAVSASVIQAEENFVSDRTHNVCSNANIYTNTWYRGEQRGKVWNQRQQYHLEKQQQEKCQQWPIYLSFGTRHIAILCHGL